LWLGIIEIDDTLGNDKRKKALKELIKKKCIIIDDVTLSGGGKSSYYYDLKAIALNPKALHLIGDLLLEEAVKHYGARSVGGLEIGAIPISTAIVLQSFGKYKGDLEGFYVRKMPKSHGLKKKIEGSLVEPVVVVDDVITTGCSVMQAIESVRKEGVSVQGIVCIVDRELDESQNLLKQNNYKYSALFKHAEFKQYIEKETKKKKRKQGQKNSI
jgi:orotate phosphoribosyltransferase